MSQQENSLGCPITDEYAKLVCWGTPGKPPTTCAFLFYTPDGNCSGYLCEKTTNQKNLLDFLFLQIARGEKSDRCSGPPDFNQITVDETKIS